ncbi:unnamed protein product [Amoebophrya sp. A120]|nr:unnamed protein product [Amoebophrya sp. A120]|eukprot:GSA120T00000024001.1
MDTLHHDHVRLTVTRRRDMLKPQEATRSIFRRRKKVC